MFFPHREMSVAKLAYIGLRVMGLPVVGYLAAMGGHGPAAYKSTMARAPARVDKQGGK